MSLAPDIFRRIADGFGTDADRHNAQPLAVRILGYHRGVVLGSLAAFLLIILVIAAEGWRSHRDVVAAQEAEVRAVLENARQALVHELDFLSQSAQFLGQLQHDWAQERQVELFQGFLTVRNYQALAVWDREGALRLAVTRDGSILVNQQVPFWKGQVSGPRLEFHGGVPVSESMRLSVPLGDGSAMSVSFSPQRLFRVLPHQVLVVNPIYGEILWQHDMQMQGALPLSASHGEGAVVDVESLPHLAHDFMGTPLVFVVAADQRFAENQTLKSTLLILFAVSLLYGLLASLGYAKFRRFHESLKTKKATVFSLANLAEWRDPETGDHLERTRNYGMLLALQLCHNPKFSRLLRKTFIKDMADASLLHDIGKVGVPDHVLLKPGKLSDEEFAIMRSHSTIGRNVIQSIIDQCGLHDPFLEIGRNIAHYHHERYDGRGYPDQLKGEEIPLEARIFALCDVYDALRSRRPYKEPISHERTCEIIRSERGGHFDPDIVDAFLVCEQEFMEIHAAYDSVDQSFHKQFSGLTARHLHIQWSENIAVGIAQIDQQHRELINRINNLFDALLLGRAKDAIYQTMAFLEEYIHEHFTTEERYMRENSYPEYQQHVAQHEHFRAQVQQMKQQLLDEGASSALVMDLNRQIVHWLTNHIAVTDKRMAQFIAHHTLTR